MSENKVAYLTQPQVVVKYDITGAVLVHRSDIANVATALINAAGDEDTRRGIALLAEALGCQVTSR